jgi:mono/diheme cytochrome c family protein
MKITFRILMGLLLSVILLWGVILFRFNSLGNSQFVQPALSIHEEVAQADLELGKRIYSVRSGCIDCHGVEYKGGKIPGGDPSWPEASNIRLGDNSTWTEQSFKNVILTGVSPTTKQTLRPPMPIALLKQMNEMEIKALWLYLSTLK